MFDKACFQVGPLDPSRDEHDPGAVIGIGPKVNNAITAGSSEPAVIGAIPDIRSVLLAWLCAGFYEAGR
jgi:hypothetical protein